MCVGEGGLATLLSPVPYFLIYSPHTTHPDPPTHTHTRTHTHPDTPLSTHPSPRYQKEEEIEKAEEAGHAFFLKEEGLEEEDEKGEGEAGEAKGEGEGGRTTPAAAGTASATPSTRHTMSRVGGQWKADPSLPPKVRCWGLGREGGRLESGPRT